jgi:sugar phosphate isomerase/epimerase
MPARPARKRYVEGIREMMTAADKWRGRDLCARTRPRDQGEGMRRRDFLMAALATPLRVAGVGREILGANTAMSGYGLYQAIDAIRRLGFRTIEIHPMGVPQPTPEKYPGFEFASLTGAEKKKICKSLEGFRRITTHLPYIGLSPFSGDPATAESSIGKINTAMEATAYFGADLAVVHIIPPRDRPEADAWPLFVRQLREWGDFAARHSFKLAFETGYPASVADFVRLAREVDHEAVGCTVDVGHQRGYKELVARVKPEQRGTPEGIRAYNDTTLEIVDRLREKVLHLHIHDIDPATWAEHKPIGTGFVDYPRLIGKLRQIGYRGLMMFEIGGPGSEIEAMLADGKRRLEALL